MHLEELVASWNKPLWWTAHCRTKDEDRLFTTERENATFLEILDFCGNEKGSHCSSGKRDVLDD